MRLLTQANDRRDFSEFGVADSLRNGKGGNGDTSKKVESKHLKIVLRQPFKDWNEILKGFLGLAERLLILELSKRVVGEEGLFTFRFQCRATLSRGVESHLARIHAGIVRGHMKNIMEQVNIWADYSNLGGER